MMTMSVQFELCQDLILNMSLIIANSIAEYEVVEVGILQDDLHSTLLLITLARSVVSS